MLDCRNGAIGSVARAREIAVTLPLGQERLRLVPRLRSALLVMPFVSSQAESARRTCSAIGTPSRSLTSRSPSKMSGSIRKAVCFFVLGVTANTV